MLYKVEYAVRDRNTYKIISRCEFAVRARGHQEAWKKTEQAACEALGGAQWTERKAEPEYVNPVHVGAPVTVGGIMGYIADELPENKILVYFPTSEVFRDIPSDKVQLIRGKEMSAAAIKKAKRIAYLKTYHPR